MANVEGAHRDAGDDGGHPGASPIRASGGPQVIVAEKRSGWLPQDGDAGRDQWTLGDGVEPRSVKLRQHLSSVRNKEQQVDRSSAHLRA